MKRISLLIIALFLVTQSKAQEVENTLPEFRAHVGLSYSPRFLVRNLGEGQPIERLGVSMYPTVDITLGDNTTAFRASLGGITRLGVVLGHKWAYCAFGYSCTLELPKETAHAIEMEIGARVKVGTEKRYHLTIGGKFDTSISGDAFGFSPTIGVHALINR